MARVTDGFVKVAAVAAAGFFRAGRFWPNAGAVVAVAELADGVLDTLLAEPQLRVTSVGGGSDPDVVTAAVADLDERVRAAVAGLDAADFDQAGKPRVDALKRVLPADAEAINAALRDRVWAAIRNLA